MDKVPLCNGMIICAPDSFKGCMSSNTACAAMVRGLQRLGIPSERIVSLPIADGGEGTTEAFLTFCPGGEEVWITVSDSFGNEKKVSYAWFGSTRTAVIEMAAASGLTQRLDPLYTTSFGTGQMIRAAVEKGAENIILGIGGTGTTDCGIGAAAALGARFLDADGTEIPLCGKGLISLSSIDLSECTEKLRNVRFTVLCDVTNPLYGERGAAYVYGPQKGAGADEVVFLDEGLRNFAQVVRQSLGKDISQLPGGGAAGGMGAGAYSFWDAELTPGITKILEISDFSEKAEKASLILTGEGRFDSQSLKGKVFRGLFDNRGSASVGVFCGSVAEEAEQAPEPAFIRAITPKGTDLGTAMLHAEEWLEEAVFQQVGPLMKGDRNE